MDQKITPADDCCEMLCDNLLIRYPFLNQDEVRNFVNIHPWLISETDSNIIHDFIKQHFASLCKRYQEINENFEKFDKQPKKEIMLIENNDSPKIIENCLNALELMNDSIYVNQQNHQLFYDLMLFIKQRLEALYNKPQDEMSRQIQLWKNTPYFNKNILAIFKSLGFEEIDLDSEVLLINNNEIRKPELKEILELIDNIYLNSSQNQSIQNMIQPSFGEIQNYARDQKHVDNSNFLASIHESRLQKKMRKSGPENNFNNQYDRSGYIANENRWNNSMDTSSIRDQINEYRQRMKNRQMDERKFTSNIITMSDIEKKRIEEEIVLFGKRALQLTNEFRKQNNLQPLAWNQELCNIGMYHSKNMGDGRVPFGHQGFDQRCKMVKFNMKSMAENVAMSNGHSDPAKVAVDGWINSPGHRKNMLSASNVCGIAAYRNADGAWYFTQLLAYKL